MCVSCCVFLVVLPGEGGYALTATFPAPSVGGGPPSPMPGLSVSLGSVCVWGGGGLGDCGCMVCVFFWGGSRF